jgi:hypothetical protein
MVLAALRLIHSTAMIFFHFQVTCSMVPRRHFDRKYFPSILNAARSEFPTFAKVAGGFGRAG